MRRSVRTPLPADLIAKIDAVRGRRTRAAEIARRLEESLRPTAADHLRAALARPDAYEPPAFVRTDGAWAVGPSDPTPWEPLLDRRYECRIDRRAGELVEPCEAERLRADGWAMRPWYGSASKQSSRHPDAYQLMDPPTIGCFPDGQRCVIGADPGGPGFDDPFASAILEWRRTVQSVRTASVYLTRADLVSVGLADWTPDVESARPPPAPLRLTVNGEAWTCRPIGMAFDESGAMVALIEVADSPTPATDAP